MPWTLRRADDWSPSEAPDPRCCSTCCRDISQHQRVGSTHGRVGSGKDFKDFSVLGWVVDRKNFQKFSNSLYIVFGGVAWWLAEFVNERS